MKKLEISVLNRYKEEKLLRCQKHPSFPLLIWNYTEKVQYDDIWDEITLNCRGLITDLEGNIIARSFKKFFNIEQSRHKETDTFEIFEKMDGSLGIVFFYNEEWHIATRGSFSSEQAIKGKEILDKKFKNHLNPDVTYLFEIIYPENRILVDYKDMEDLVFLDALNKDGSRANIDLNELSDFPFAKKYHFENFKEIQKLNWENSEGFIVLFSNGERCKIKFPDYVELHRKLSNISEKAVWELICERKPISEFLDIIPDEFHELVKNWYKNLTENIDYILKSVKEEYKNKLNYIGKSEESIKNDRDLKKQFAISIKDYKYKALLFSLLSNKDIFLDVCNLVKPSGSQSLIFEKE